MNAKKGALGRGLGALLGTDNVQQMQQGQTEPAVLSISSIPLENIELNPYQPRDTFDTERLQELADSIKALGVIQPISVRRIKKNKYQLICGERRYRASALLGLPEIPAYIRTADDNEMLQMALVENIQRENLNAIEIAISYQRLVEECNLTQEALSQNLGKDRSTITNFLRLLKLPAEVQLAVRENRISMGHARALLSLRDNKTLLKAFQEVISKDLSVRKTEELAKRSNEPSPTTENTVVISKYQSTTLKASEKLGTSVRLKSGKNGRGEMIIAFRSEDQLNRILRKLRLD